jgi:hypothetical protein
LVHDLAVLQDRKANAVPRCVRGAYGEQTIELPFRANDDKARARHHVRGTIQHQMELGQQVAVLSLG